MLTTTLMRRILKLCQTSELSAKWLEKNATASNINAFIACTKATGATPIFHVTNLERARRIYQSRKIYGIDVVNSAHFHYTHGGAARQAFANGVALGFSWQGTVAKVDLSKDSSSHLDRRPNVLFDVPNSEYSQETWELRLYPRTINLPLSYVQVENTGFTLHMPIALEVVDGE